MDRIAPSARLKAQIEELLSSGLSENGDHLAVLGRLGARLVLQRAVEEEVEAFLGRAATSDIDGERLAQRDAAKADPDRRGGDQRGHAPGT